MKQRVLAAEPGYILTERSGLLAPQKFALVEVVGINVPVEPVRWHGSASLGFSLTTGNSETENFALAISLLRRSEIDRITFDAAYLYGRQSDPDTDEDFTSTDRWFAELKYDYFFTKKVYGYAAARVEQDHVAELDLRLLAGAGAGYQWIETADFNFRTEAGVAWLYEGYEGNGSSDAVVLRLAYYLTKQFLAGRLTVFHDLQVYPAFEDFSDVFLTTQAGLRTSLIKAMFAETKVVLNYDSTPAPGAKDTDLQFLAKRSMSGVGKNGQ
jgi:putative salt-induced outer membrane protein YdiY